MSQNQQPHTKIREMASRLSDKGAGSGGLVTPGGGQDTDGLVVAGQTVDTRLDENEAELAVLVLAVALKVLADGDGLQQSVRRENRTNRKRCNATFLIRK
jgi:hypothetical protein